MFINPLNAELNPIRHLLALLGGATIVVVSRLRVKTVKLIQTCRVLVREPYGMRSLGNPRCRREDNIKIYL